MRSVEFLDLCHFLSAALTLERCSLRSSDSQGADGVMHAGLDDSGQKSYTTITVLGRTIATKSKDVS